MYAVAPISNIEARIGAIQQRITPGAGGSSSAGFDEAYLAAVDAATEPVGFEPFGAAYQQAVAASQKTAVASAAITSYSSARMQTVGSGGATFAVGGTGSSVGQVGGYGGMTVPQALEMFGNGTLPDSALQSIGQGGHKLYGPAAQAWRSAVAAAAAEGVDLRVTDSYRTYDQQVELAERKGLYADGGLAATPGTSNHGWGLAVDVDVTDPATLDWIKTNGYRFGFVEAVPREPWHWEFRPQQA